MRRYFSFLVMMGLLMTGVPVFAAERDVYADGIYGKSALNLLTPDNALGAPNETYADFRAKDVYMYFDLGEGEEALGDVTLTVKQLAFGAAARAMLYDKDRNQLATLGAIFQPGQTEIVFHYDGETPYRYIDIVSTEDEQWRLDAVVGGRLAEEDESEELTPIPEPEPEPEPEEESDIFDLPPGTLIKTAASPSVYRIDGDGKRHAFPGEAVFTSWGYSFEDSTIVTVSVEEIAQLTLGKNVTMYAGSLVKITTDPKVYVVEGEGILRWLRSEEMARDQYGANWAKRVVDVPDVFWKNYTVGNPL